MNAVPRRVGCLPMCHVRVNRHRMAASNQYITKYTRKLVRSVVVIILFLFYFSIDARYTRPHQCWTMETDTGSMDIVAKTVWTAEADGINRTDCPSGLKCQVSINFCARHAKISSLLLLLLLSSSSNLLISILLFNDSPILRAARVIISVSVTEWYPTILQCIDDPFKH